MSLKDTVRRWSSYMRERGKRPRIPPMAMAPWDENTWFLIPKFSSLSPPNTTPAPPAVAADPQRVAIIFSAQGTAGCIIGNDPVSISSAGLRISSLTNPVIFIQEEHGPLPSIQWFATSISGTEVLSIVEITLRAWPHGV